MFLLTQKEKPKSHGALETRGREIGSHQPPEADIEQKHHEDEAGGGSFGVSGPAVEELGIVAVFLGEG